MPADAGPQPDVVRLGEEDEPRRLVAPVGLRERPRPGVLDVVDDETDELLEVRVRVGARVDAAARGRHLPEGVEPRLDVDAGPAAATSDDAAPENERKEEDDEAQVLR